MDGRSQVTGRDVKSQVKSRYNEPALMNTMSMISVQCYHIPAGQEGQHLGQEEDKSHRNNQQCEKNEMVLSRAHQPPQRQPRVLPHGDDTTRKDGKGDQPSGGETTWTNTGAIHSGR